MLIDSENPENAFFIRDFEVNGSILLATALTSPKLYIYCWINYFLDYAIFDKQFYEFEFKEETRSHQILPSYQTIGLSRWTRSALWWQESQHRKVSRWIYFWYVLIHVDNIFGENVTNQQIFDVIGDPLIKHSL